MPKSTPAFEYLIDVKKGRRRETLTVTIGQPKPVKAGDWACHVTLKGIKEEEADFQCGGLDGLQSLILALVYLRATFRRLAKAGFCFIDPISDECIDPAWYFLSLEKK